MSLAIPGVIVKQPCPQTSQICLIVVPFGSVVAFDTEENGIAATAAYYGVGGAYRRGAGVRDKHLMVMKVPFREASEETWEPRMAP